MLLVILGEDASRLGRLAQNVDEDVVQGIYAGVSANYDSAATRDIACLLIYNAMLCPRSRTPLVQHAHQPGVHTGNSIIIARWPVPSVSSR